MEPEPRRAEPYGDLVGKTALVTGAFGGLGRHFAETLGRAGCRVVLAGRRRAAGEAVLAGIRSAGGEAFLVEMDVRDPDAVKRGLESAAAAFGAMDIVVNNAGISMTKPALDLDEADWSAVVDTNLGGAWRVAQAAGRQMRDAGKGGVIINVASILGLRVAQQLAPYVSAKAGLIHLTKALALEWARYGIRVNAIAPGYLATDMNAAFFETDAGKALVKRIPQRRLGQPRFLDGPLLLLASNLSEYMTGAVIPVDGGHLANTL